MKRTVIYILIVLAIPALCQGSVGAGPDLGLPVFQWAAYHLDLERSWCVDHPVAGSLDLAAVGGRRAHAYGSLDRIHGGMPHGGRPAPGDMMSMMSFVWAQLFGGVDIIAEVKDFARQVRLNKRTVKNSRSQRRDMRDRWKFVVSCRVDQQTEVAALFKNRGRLFGDGSLAFEINALDPLSEEIGVTVAYSNGDLDIRADRMTLTQTAAAKLVVKF